MFNQMILGRKERIKEGRTDLDMVYEIILKLGLPLTEEIVEQQTTDGKKFYCIGEDTEHIICVEKDIN